MLRPFAPLLACLTTLSLGCCMCDAPHDYCYPTYAGECGDHCRTHERINSAFTGPTLADGEYHEMPSSIDAHGPGRQPTMPSPGPEPYYLDQSAQAAPPRMQSASRQRPEKRQTAKKSLGLFGGKRFVWIEKPNASR